MKKYLIATAAFVILGFAIAGIWHLALFGEAYQSLHIYTREPIFALGALSFVLEGLTFSYLFQSFRKGKNPVKEGVIFGVLAFGVLMGSVGALAEAAKFSSTSLPAYIALEGAFYLIAGAVLGGAVGWIYGKKS